MNIPKILKTMISDSKYTPESWHTFHIVLGLLFYLENVRIDLTKHYLALGFAFTLKNGDISSLIVNKQYLDLFLFLKEFEKQMNIVFETEEIEA